MLLSFEVTNFKSFKHSQVFELASTASKEFKDSLYEIDSNHKINRTACIVGANSSGKTHFLQAIESFSDAISKPAEVKKAHQPFRLDNISSTKPTQYEVLLYDENRMEYINYSFSILNGKVLHESLHTKDKRKNAKIKVLFERDEHGLKFSRENRFLEELLLSTVDSGGLVTNYASGIKNDSIKFVNDWATKVFLFNPNRMNHLGPKLFELIYKQAQSSNDGDEIDLLMAKMMTNINSVLKSLDLPIKDVIYKLSEEGTPFLTVIPKTLSDSDLKLTMSEAKDFFSEGTFNTLNIIIIIELFSSGNTTLLIDEYDGTLHHKLSLGVLDLIRSKDKRFASQMIMSTHDILLIDKDFRRDAIFIFRKCNELSTQITRVSDYSVRKDAKLSLKYLNEEFGMLPKIVSENFND